MTHLEQLRAESAPIADAIEENEDVIRSCTGDCSFCDRDTYMACQLGDGP